MNDLFKLHTIIDRITINNGCKNVEEARIGAQCVPFGIHSRNCHRC